MLSEADKTPLLWSNVALAGSSALAIVLNIIAALVVYLCRRKSSNKSTQKFLLALTLEGVGASLLPGAIYSITQVMKWEWVQQVCGGLTWSFASLAFLQAATSTSALLDRLYAIRWRTQYAKRINQKDIKYHLMASSVVCACLGAIPTFLRTIEKVHCPFLPYDFTFGYGAFVCVIYIFLLIVTTVSLVLLFLTMRKLKWEGWKNDVFLVNQIDYKEDRIAKATESDYTSSLTSSLKPLSTFSSLVSSSKFEKSADLSNLSYRGNNSLNLSNSSSSWNRRRKVREKLGEMESYTDQWKTIVVITVVDYLLLHLPLLAVTVTGTIQPETIGPTSPLLEHIAIWLLVGKVVILPVIILCDKEYFHFLTRRLFCCRLFDVEEMRKAIVATDEKVETYEDIGGGNSGFYVSLKSNSFDTLADDSTKQGKLVMTPSFKVESTGNEKPMRKRNHNMVAPSSATKMYSKRREWKQNVIKQQMPGLYAYINEAFKALEADQRLKSGGKLSNMKRSQSLDHIEKQTDSGYEDHVNNGYESDPSETKDGHHYRTSDLAVVVNKSTKQGSRQVGLYQLSPDGQDVVRLFPATSEHETKEARRRGHERGGSSSSDEQVYVIPVKNYGDMSVYKIALSDVEQTEDLFGDSDSECEVVKLSPTSDQIKSAGKSVIDHSNMGSLRSKQNKATSATDRRQPDRQQSIKQAVKSAFLNEYRSDEDTLTRTPKKSKNKKRYQFHREAAPATHRQVPTDEGLFGSRPIEKKASINRAVQVAALLSHSAEDLRPKRDVFPEVLPSVYYDRIIRNRDKNLRHENWDRIFRKFTILEDALETLDVTSLSSNNSNTDKDFIPPAEAIDKRLRHEPGPDLSICAYI